MVAFTNGVNMGLDQELNQERGLITHNQEATEEEKPLLCKGSQQHARRDSNPQPSDP
jgi:hypothetical protein